MIDIAYAAGAPPGGAGGPFGQISTFLPLILMFAVFYFLLIRPQQKRKRETQEMLSNLKKGDRVLTTGGIYGTVVQLSGNTVLLKIADQVKVEIARGHITGIVKAGGEADSSSSS